MSQNPNGFVHSRKVPQLYKLASKLAQLVVEKGASLKELVFDKSNSRHLNTKGLYALIVTTIQHGEMLDTLIRESQLLFKEDRLDPWLARILITELIWGKKKLPPSDSKPINTILEYQPVFLATLREAVKSGKHENEPRSDPALLKPRYIRVNTLTLSVGDAVNVFRYEGWRRATPPADDYASFLDKLAHLEEDEFLQDFHVKQLFAFPPRTEFFDHRLYQDGSLVLQDKATCLAPFLLDPPPGSAVLDMCAAPGLKTTQLAAIMGNTGTLYAVERHAMRYKTLCDFVTSHGVTNVTTINADATTITPEECQNVEYILVDPSCSGSGMSRPAARGGEDFDKDRLPKLAAFQLILLEKALTKFPNVKRVVYSTCSVYPQENEEVVREALKNVNLDAERPRFKLADNVLPAWTNRGSDDFEFGHRCLFADPKKDLTTGFFIAVFERVDLTDQDNCHKKKGKKGSKRVKSLNEGGPRQNGGAALEDTEGREEDGESEGNRKKKKWKEVVEEEIVVDVPGDVEEYVKKHKKKKRKRELEEMEVASIVDTPEEVDGENVRKHKKVKNAAMMESESVQELSVSNDKKKHKKKRKRELEELEVAGVVDTTEEVDGENVRKHKKKKKEKRAAMMESESVQELSVNNKKKHKKKEKEA